MGKIMRPAIAFHPRQYIRPRYMSHQRYYISLGIQIFLFIVFGGRDLPPCSGTMNSSVIDKIVETEVQIWKMLSLSLLGRYDYVCVEEGAGNELVDSDRGNKIINIHEKQMNAHVNEYDIKAF